MMKRIKIFLFIFLYLLIIINIITNNFSKYKENELRKQKKEIKTLEKYKVICKKGVLLNKKLFKKVKEPKISIISPIYNKEKYILQFIRSIQNQYFDDIEIILVDDCSKDNTKKEIEKLQKVDERIILIKHKNNKGTLISRNDGSMISKGKYLIFGDPDDLFSNDIFYFCFKEAEIKNYDMIRYNIYNGNNKINLDNIVNSIQSRKICQPKLSLYLFYGLGELKEIDYFVCNKFIKKDLFISALKKIDKYYLNQNMIDCEDGLINFILHRNAKSYYFIKKIGYYYLLNDESITNNNKDNLKKRLKSNFLYFKFIFQYTHNNERDKKIADYIFSSIYENYKLYIYNFFKEFAKDLLFYKDIINMYLNCYYISKGNKNILNKIKIYIDNYTTIPN